MDTNRTFFIKKTVLFSERKSFGKGKRGGPFSRRNKRMGKLEKSLNETIEEILKIAPKITAAKIVQLLGVNARSICRTNAWKKRKKRQRKNKGIDINGTVVPK